jgi:tetratricopeptide (TPR) repeat protein
MPKKTKRQTATALAIFLLLPLLAQTQTGPHESDNEIHFFQWKISQDPDDFSYYDRLGIAYIQKARETGDLTYYDLASKALEKSLALQSEGPDAAPAKKHLATVFYAYHRFGDALKLAQEAIELYPGDITPYALIGDARSETGDYEQAWADWRHLQNPAVRQSAESGVQYLVESRASVKSLLTGDTKAAIDHMRSAVDISVSSRMARETIAWSDFTLGDDYFQTGDLADAQAAYNDALKAYPDYHRALAGSARVSAAEGHLNEAIGLYRRAIGIIPLPVYAAALGDVYARAGKPAEAKKQYNLVEYIGRLNNFNRVVYNRELSLFWADHDVHPEEALELARKELEVRHDIYTSDALAWALYRNNRGEEAVAAMKEALRLGTQDPLLFFHAGMIYQLLGDNERTVDYLDRAMALNPQFHVSFADVARATLRKLSAQPGTAHARH